MFQLIRRKLVILVILAMILETIPVFAYSKPEKLELSTSKISAFVGEEFTVKSKGKGRVKAVFTPKDSDCGIIVKKIKGKDGIVEINKVTKYFYELKALKKGSIWVNVSSRKNKKLQKKFKLIVKAENETNRTDAEGKEIKLEDFTLSQALLDWENPNHPKTKSLSLSTKDMKAYVKLITPDGEKFDSSIDKGFEFKSSDEKIFTMRGNTVIPVEKGKATLQVEFNYKEKLYRFKVVDINIGDYYPVPTSILLNQYSTWVRSNGTDENIKIKAVIDQYGNELDADEAEWSLECFDYETNPVASKFGNTITIEGNNAFPTLYKMNVRVTMYGVTAQAVFDIVVRR